MSQEPMNNFTPRAQQVLALARKEADRFHHNYVGTEHILLGLIKLGQGVAVSVLQKMGLDLETVRAAVEKQVGTGQETKAQGSIPYTPRVKKVLALAGKEAKALNHSYVGTEHILLGLLREGSGFSDAPAAIRSSFEHFIGLPSFPFAPLTVSIMRLRTGIDVNRIRPADVIARISPRPLLIVHCMDDKVVPPDNSERNFAAARLCRPCSGQ